jgi:sporulation protein YlmC with PRC-barrel domain
MAYGGYRNARPGNDVRVLVAAANILARYGQQQSCEAVLSSTREAYKAYVADFRGRGAPMADVPGWRKQEIAAAVPVAGMNASFRSDELLGADVRSPQGDALGSVDDLVMSPKTGKIAYLVIARGGLFGFGEKYVPIPWAAFKTTPSLSLLVLNTTKVDLDAAPLVAYEKFSAPGSFDQESEKVEAYWKTRLSN